MPEVNVAVTAWVPRKYLTFLTLITGVLLALGIGIVIKSNSPKFSVSDQVYTAEIVGTDAARQQGLSGRSSLPGNHVMLFVFDDDARRCFWMKDMKFAIDIVWLDASKKVVAIEHAVQPDSYPAQFCHDNARYVAEFAAGTAQKHGITLGAQAKF